MSIQAVASNFWIACFKKILGNTPVVRAKDMWFKLMQRDNMTNFDCFTVWLLAPLFMGFV